MLQKLLQIYGSFIKKDTGKPQECSKHRQERKLQISRYMLYMKIFLKCVYLSQQVSCGVRRGKYHKS